MSSTSSSTAHIFSHQQSIPSLRIALSVVEAYDELWSVQDASQATYWLQVLHGALLRDRVDTYDPSDVFHCIQAAALNYPGTWEHAVWAAAALVRACVGPAWRIQRTGEGSRNNGSTATTLSESTGDSGPTRQYSPRSFSPLTLDPHQHPYPYPYIPEVLPGAVLRLAAKAPMASRSLAKAQRELVLALCCTAFFDHQNRAPEWTIYGAHGPIETMMRFWLESLTSTCLKINHDGEEIHEPQTYPIIFRPDEGASELVNRLGRRTMDWWYTLNVARACSDLVSAGWRPHRKCQIIVLHLLDIVEQGITLKHMSPTAVHKSNREERLAASSSAAEAISALASLGSRRLISPLCQVQLVNVLVQLQVIAGKSHQILHLLYPRGNLISTEEEHAWNHEFETFIQQRALCFVDSAELLWVLLAQENASDQVTATLLAVANHDLERAVVVVRIVSGALWEKSPNAPRIPTLRMYWNEFLGLLRRLAVPCIELLSNSNATNENVCCYKELTLLLEVVAAVGRLVASEMIRGMGILATDEWDSLLQIIRTIVIPFLRLDAMMPDTSYTSKDETCFQKHHKIWKIIQAECETCIMKLGEFLKQSSKFEADQYYSIASCKHRDNVHFCLLRDATQVVSKPASLAIDVLRSWAAIGFQPCRQATWIDTASAIVADAFAVHEDLSTSNFGGFVHSPLVRLEALLLLSNDDAYASPLIDAESTQTITTTPANGAQSVCCIASPLSSTQQVPEEYRQLVRSVIFPSLSLVFKVIVGDERAGGVLRFSHPSAVVKITVDTYLCQMLSKEMSSEKEEYDNGACKLRKYAIYLVGRLFCSDVGGNEYKSQLLYVMTQAALMRSLRLPIQTLDPGRAACIVTNRALLSLAAIGQIETCMYAPFSSVPHNHSSIPGLVDTLCLVLRHFSDCACLSTDEFVHSKQQEFSFRVLLFAALLPLSRLRKSNAGGLLLVGRDEAMAHLPDDIAALLSEQRCDLIDDAGPFVAPFTYVDTDQKTIDPSISTPVSFEPIITTLIVTLGISWDRVDVKGGQSDERSQSLDWENRFRSSCYDALTNYIMSGSTWTTPKLVATLLNFRKKEGLYSATEDFCRLRATVSALQSLVHHSHTSSTARAPVLFPWDEVTDLVAQVLNLCFSRILDDVTIGCKLLIGIFPCLASSRLEDVEAIRGLHCSILKSLISRLSHCLHMDCPNDAEDISISNGDEKHCPSLLLLLYECTLYYIEFFACVPADDAKHLVRLCYAVASKNESSRCSCTLAVRCAVTVLDRLDASGVDDLMNLFSSTINDDLPMGSISKASHLELPESDLILSALYYRSISFRANKTLWAKYMKSNDHFQLALECDNMKIFDSEKECAAAWLCGDHLLTCKLGGINSRRCGWVEVTIRGATFRHRELVRLSNSLSIEHPELPSSLWSEPISSDPDSASFQVELCQHDGNDLQDALKLLEKCDLMLGAKEDAVFETNRESHFLKFPDKIRLSSSASHLSSDGSFQSCDASNINEETPVSAIPAQIEAKDRSSIRTWLVETFEKPSHVEEVAKLIAEMGLSEVLDNNHDADKRQYQKERVELQPVVRLNMDEKAARDINLLDRTVVLDTHKIALLFAGPPEVCDADDQVEVDYLLKVQSASPTFFDFCKELGKVVMTRHMKYFSAGLDTSGNDTDGMYALVWIENSEENILSSSFLTIFHTVAYMPANVNNRKRHVGNDSVHIVFCDPSSCLHERVWAGGMEEEFENVLISGEFGFVTIFVIPTAEGFFRVKVQLRPCLPEDIRRQLHHLPGEDIVSTKGAPNFVRRLANLADVACSAVTHETIGPTMSWEIRLRQLRQMKRHTMVLESLNAC